MTELMARPAPGGRERAGWRRRLARLADAAATPHRPADYLDLFAPLRAGADLRARVVAVEPETADAATLLLRPGADWAGHRPGQYLRIGIEVDGAREWRAYSLTHGPRPDGLISITVKAVPDGVVSPYLVHRTRPGTMVHLEQAAGDFVLSGAERKLLFVTAGSGITPVIGMLRNLFPATEDGVLIGERGRDLDIVVVHLAPSEPQTIFAADLAALDAAGAITLISRYDDRDGIFDVAELDALVGDLGERSAYACGPAGLLDALTDHCESRGTTLSTERFRPAFAPAGAEGSGGTVAFADGRVVEAAAGTPILDAAESAGVLMPSGCRMGICFGCVLPLTEGSVRDLRNGAVTTVDPVTSAPGGVPIQTCISAAAGACHLDH